MFNRGRKPYRALREDKMATSLIETKVWTDKEYVDAIASAYRNGIKEVVAWIEDGRVNIVGLSLIAKEEWETKLKDWGIE